jgi:predicted RNA binding protein YcfA (HicA-like mRNA interferase family)
MGGQYPRLDCEQVERILANAGFIKKRQEGSSHSQWEGYTKGVRRIVTVDQLGGKKKEKYGPKLLSNMIRQSGLSKHEFYSYLSYLNK